MATLAGRLFAAAGHLFQGSGVFRECPFLS
jgi:hypothetical protein